MAYYPGDYQHLADFYSQSLFSFSTNSPLSLSDPYTYTSAAYDPDDDHHQQCQQRQHRSRPPPAASTSHSSLPERYSSPTFVTPPSARSSSPPLKNTPTPSKSYLTFSSIPSTTLSSPTRKLLVLDLNGTLLLRNPRPPRSARGQYHPHPAPRRVMPRPYLPALRSYFFAPRTRAWLDVMVWSSAQPHSVDDMILHTFGSDRAELVAVWARDTLGLAEDHYHRKVQTIKDLEKPWAALAAPEQGRASSPSSIASSRSASASPEPAPAPFTHSAATTILLDDSHAKAALQPYNHLCVREYTRSQRNADLTALGLNPEPHQTPRAPLPPPPPPVALETTTPQDEETRHAAGKGNKRKRGKERQQQQSDEEGGEGGAETLDETLLAVIGILHDARLQSSVAGWLRAGSLLRSQPQHKHTSTEWFDDPVLMSEWACRGREAMRELGLVIEHGVKP